MATWGAIRCTGRAFRPWIWRLIASSPWPKRPASRCAASSSMRSTTPTSAHRTDSSTPRTSAASRKWRRPAAKFRSAPVCPSETNGLRARNRRLANSLRNSDGGASRLRFQKIAENYRCLVNNRDRSEPSGARLENFGPANLGTPSEWSSRPDLDSQRRGNGRICTCIFRGSGWNTILCKTAEDSTWIH